MAAKTATDTEEVLQQIQTLRATVSSLSFSDDAARNKVLQETQSLLRELETPLHTIQRVCGLNIWETVVLDTAATMGLLSLLASSNAPIPAVRLANECNAELLLVQRLLRCLVVFGAIREHDHHPEPLYSATNITRTFATPRGGAAIRSSLEFLAPGWVRLPQHLRAHGYRVLESGDDTVYNRVHNAPGQTLWQILGPTAYAGEWGLFMEAFNAGHRDWLDFYPVQERLIDGSAGGPTDDPFMVDIGGCSGTQALAFRERFPAVQGRFVVQDLADMLPPPPEVPNGIERVAHDFFGPFPPSLRGARLYYMRYISHDWSQARLVRILSNVRAAMRPGHSRLIIHDWILPERDVPPFMATQDLNMMTLGGGEERSERRHREAVEAAGLVVTGVWDPRDGKSEGVIECELVVPS